MRCKPRTGTGPTLIRRNGDRTDKSVLAVRAQLIAGTSNQCTGDVTLDPEPDGRCVEASQSQIRFGQKFAERVNVRERDRIERHTLDYRTTDSVR